MNSSHAHRKRVLVVGGGITGLAAAHRLIELDPMLEVLLLEAGSRLGGVLETVRREGFLIERSADNFITDVPWAVDLCRRVGLGDQLLSTSSRERGAMVVHRGRLEKLPQGFMLMAPGRIWPLVTTPILSPWGKVRLLGELFVPRRADNGDESLGSFARRRLGREAFERIVQPLVGGIYTADPDKLSLKATLPRFVDMERQHGSLIRAAMRRRATTIEGASLVDSGARYGLFVAPRDGLTSFIEAIARRLPTGCVRLNSPVETISRGPDGTWEIQLARTSEPSGKLSCDGVIVAAPAYVAARILAGLDVSLADELGSIAYATSAVVSLAYRRDQLSCALDSFGFVVPAIEGRRILAGSFSSVKFAGRAPRDAVLVRVFIGGACQAELAELDDEGLRRIAQEELGVLLGARGEPIVCDISRWPRSMPQYHLGHCELVEAIQRRMSAWPGLALAGSAYRGVGIPHCIHGGETAAEQVYAAARNR